MSSRRHLCLNYVFKVAEILLIVGFAAASYAGPSFGIHPLVHDEVFPGVFDWDNTQDGFDYEDRREAMRSLLYKLLSSGQAGQAFNRDDYSSAQNSQNRPIMMSKKFTTLAAKTNLKRDENEYKLMSSSSLGRLRSTPYFPARESSGHLNSKRNQYLLLRKGRETSGEDLALELLATNTKRGVRSTLDDQRRIAKLNKRKHNNH